MKGFQLACGEIERVLKEQGWIKPEERVALLNTGSGLKYPETVESNPRLLQPGDKIIVA